jgi:hypothetical protein
LSNECPVQTTIILFSMLQPCRCTFLSKCIVIILKLNLFWL